MAKSIRVDTNDNMRALWRAWMQARVEEVHRRVTVFDVLQQNGIKLRYTDREGQISCPFHGKDNHPSARVYPGDVRGPSHVWCFACNERWDCITLWKKFDGRDEFKFSTLLRDIENSYGITVPPKPEDIGEYESGEDQEYFRLASLFTSCEVRLVRSRKAFDMGGYLKVGVVLDRLFRQMEEKKLPYEDVERLLRQVLDKIGEKRRACPAD